MSLSSVLRRHREPREQVPVGPQQLPHSASEFQSRERRKEPRALPWAQEPRPFGACPRGGYRWPKRSSPLGGVWAGVGGGLLAARLRPEINLRATSYAG